MKPIIDLCARTKYDAADNVAQSGDNLLIMCDSKCHNNAVVPNLGTGSASSPCRIGLTCITLLDKYITIQQDPRCTTLLHIDSTHSIVKQKYAVFVFGFSVGCGKLYPIVYLYTSQRTGVDPEWCCSNLKRVICETFMIVVSPQIMTDADNAQFNVCSTQFPRSTILICWFYVCENVWDRDKRATLAPVTVGMIFLELNSLRFARDEQEF
ncbi:MULE transposase domain [Phytophthora cactorum]|nr:MULE transposase domain [Phytophthora cactorum]